MKWTLGGWLASEAVLCVGWLSGVLNVLKFAVINNEMRASHLCKLYYTQCSNLD